MPPELSVVAELTDDALVERVKQQDRAAFALLYDRYAPIVYAVAAHMLNAQDAEEIVQDVFLRFWNRAEQFDQKRGVFRAWLLTIARNQTLDRLKDCSREQRLFALQEIERLLHEPAQEGVSISDDAWQQQRQEAMARALHELPVEQRRAILMAYFGGLSQSAIADALHLPLGTVKKRIRLGLQKLREFMSPWRE